MCVCVPTDTMLQQEEALREDRKKREALRDEERKRELEEEKLKQQREV